MLSHGGFFVGGLYHISRDTPPKESTPSDDLVLAEQVEQAPRMAAFHLMSSKAFADFLQRSGVDKQTAYQWATALENDLNMRRLPVDVRFDMAVDEEGQ